MCLTLPHAQEVSMLQLWSVVDRGMTQETPVCLQDLASITAYTCGPPPTCNHIYPSRFLFTLAHPLAGSLIHHASY